MDRLSIIKSFNHVIDARSYTVAARQLGLSRSHLSKQIKELEDFLGVRLINRTTKHVHPTELGLAYHEISTRIVTELDEADFNLGKLSREPRGTLKILVPKSLAVNWLVEAIHIFNQRHSDLEVAVLFLDQDVSMIEHGFDLSIRIGKQNDSSLISRKIGALQYTLCATTDYLRTHGVPKHPKELTRHVCLRHIKTAKDSHWRFYGPDGAINVKIHGPFSSNSSTLLREFVLAGHGIGVLPSFSVQNEIERGALVSLLTKYRLPPSPLFASYSDKRHLPAKVSLFVEFLAGYLKRI